MAQWSPYDYEGGMNSSLSKELAVAKEALNEALIIAQTRFRSMLELSVKDFTGDIVTDVDLLCEETITRVIREAFADHAVVLEEAQDYQSDSSWTWIIDPLDGTNNYAYGLPLWGIAITLCYEHEPVLACIAEGSTGTITTAIGGQGVSLDGKPWNVVAHPHKHASAAFWMGYKTNRDAKDTRELLDVLSRSTRRVFENWAPVVDVGLFLRGGIDVIVGKECSGTELPAALLILREAGASVLDVNGFNVTLSRIPRLFIVGHDPIARRLAYGLQTALVQA